MCKFTRPLSEDVSDYLLSYWDNTAGKTLEDAIDFMAQFGVIVVRNCLI